MIVIATRWLDAIAMNSSRMSRGTPISSVISVAGTLPTVLTKSTSAPGSIRSRNSSVIPAIVGFRLRTRLGRSAFMKMSRTCPWRGGSRKIMFSSSGSPRESFPRAIKPRTCAGVNPGLRSSSCAHAGSWPITVAGSLASPIRKPYRLQKSSGLLST